MFQLYLQCWTEKSLFWQSSLDQKNSFKKGILRPSLGLIYLLLLCCCPYFSREDVELIIRCAYQSGKNVFIYAWSNVFGGRLNGVEMVSCDNYVPQEGMKGKDRAGGRPLSTFFVVTTTIYVHQVTKGNMYASCRFVSQDTGELPLCKKGFLRVEKHQ